MRMTILRHLPWSLSSQRCHVLTAKMTLCFSGPSDIETKYGFRESLNTVTHDRGMLHGPSILYVWVLYIFCIRCTWTTCTKDHHNLQKTKILTNPYKDGRGYSTQPHHMNLFLEMYSKDIIHIHAIFGFDHTATWWRASTQFRVWKDPKLKDPKVVSKQRFIMEYIQSGPLPVISRVKRSTCKGCNPVTHL